MMVKHHAFAFGLVLPSVIQSNLGVTMQLLYITCFVFRYSILNSVSYEYLNQIQFILIFLFNNSIKPRKYPLPTNRLPVIIFLILPSMRQVPPFKHISRLHKSSCSHLGPRYPFLHLHVYGCWKADEIYR